MSDEFKRKLTAIMSADVAGYSRLMDDDEEATIRTLKEYRSFITDTVNKYRGRIIDSPGDNILAEFASVVDAVKCAVEIQQELHTKNAELSDDRKMEFRIGINLGDVVEEDDRIYGDGVNIAARIESLADSGGICMSGNAYEQVVNKLNLEYEDLGKHQVKNIKRPVRVYKIPIEIESEKDTEESILDSIIDMSVPTDKPSIAVLPFVNISGDPEQEFFCDGITEEIITALSKVHDFLVIASTSTFTYKGKQVKINQVGKELGVRYVLEGSVRKSGDRIRIAAQLVEATTGKHLWAERYDRKLEDFFDIQDEITLQILKELQIKLSYKEMTKFMSRGISNLDAYLKYFQAQEAIGRFNKNDNIFARQLAEEVINLDPTWVGGYLLAGMSYLLELNYGWSRSPEESIEKVIYYSNKIKELDANHSGGYVLRSRIFLLQGQYDKAINELVNASGLQRDADYYTTLGYALFCVGKPGDVIELGKNAIRISPFYWSHYSVLGIAYCDLGQYKEAIKIINKAIQLKPDNAYIRSRLVVTYLLAGQLENALIETKKIYEIDPSFSFEKAAYAISYKNQTDTDRILNALRKAGLK